MSDAVGDLGGVFGESVSTLRMTPGATPKVSIMDFAMEVTGKNNKLLSETIRKMVNVTPDFFENLEKFQFSGRGQTEQYVLCCSECVELMMMLPGKKAKEFRRNSASLLTRLFAGDPTLHDLIEQNGLSGGVLNQFAAGEVRGGLEDQDSDEDMYTDQMIEVNNGYELTIAKYNNEIIRVNNDMEHALEDRKHALEERKKALMLSTDHVNENHTLVQMRMLKTNKEKYDMCMEDDNTEAEKTELYAKFKQARNDIMNDTIDKCSVNNLISSRGVHDSDGLVSVTVDHVIAKAAIQENKKRAREEAKQAEKMQKEKNAQDKQERRNNLQRTANMQKQARADERQSFQSNR
jgi:hypothetical protein